MAAREGEGDGIGGSCNGGDGASDAGDGSGDAGKCVGGDGTVATRTVSGAGDWRQRWMFTTARRRRQRVEVREEETGVAVEETVTTTWAETAKVETMVAM